MTQQPQAIRVALPTNGPGQHLAFLSLPASYPALFVGDRIWARKHEELGTSASYMVEYWGESTSITNGVASLSATTAPDVPFLLDEEAGQLLAPLNLTLNGQEVDKGQPSITNSNHGIEAKYLLGGPLKGSCRLLIPARHPYGYLTIIAKSVILKPNHTPMVVLASTPTSRSVSMSSILMDCQCRFDGQLRGLRAIPNPERDLAKANALASPRVAALVGVE